MLTYEQIQQHLREDAAVQRGLDEAHRISDAITRAASEPIDPWVNVGTTTIDGSRAHVAAVFGCRPHGLGPTLTQAQGCACLVGGRMLRVSSYDLDDEMSIVHCDIVRRQSEIDAEEYGDGESLLPIVTRGPCPECGPHGNAGRVLLLESWADCMTCAGGKPGDVWSEVQTERPALRALAIGDLVFDRDMEVARGFQMPTADEYMNAIGVGETKSDGCGLLIKTLLGWQRLMGWPEDQTTVAMPSIPITITVS